MNLTPKQASILLAFGRYTYRRSRRGFMTIKPGNIKSEIRFSQLEPLHQMKLIRAARMSDGQSIIQLTPDGLKILEELRSARRIPAVRYDKETRQYAMDV